jgi:quercetin dioxygenase-like cupin family protein
MARAPVPEAKLVETDAGMKPEGDGWFVLNVADSMSKGVDEDEYEFRFEGAPKAFPHFGINVTVLGPGRATAMYHAEAGQEAFLVLQGECILIVEEQERPLRQWDFVHCPPNTAHVIVGAGEGPCALLMVGARNAGSDLVYLASRAASKYGVGVDEDTEDGEVAYAGWAPTEPRRFPWPPR